MSEPIAELFMSNGFWAVVGALLGSLLGYGFSRLQERQKTHDARDALGGLLYGELLTTPPETLFGEEPPTARKLVFSALPQLLAPGVLDSRKDTALLMLLIQFNEAVENFNDKARTYNTAWASDQHPQTQRRIYLDLEPTFQDYKKAHEQLMHQIERVGELGGPLPIGELRKLSTKQRLIDWRDRRVRLWKARRRLW